MSATYSREVGAAFDAVATTYDEHYSRRSDRIDSAFIARRARELYALVAPGLFVDLGCGPGTMIPWLQLPNDAYLGVDISQGMIDEARRRWGDYGYRFALGDENYAIRGEVAFVLGAFGPLQYTDELGWFADGIRLSLRPGGRFLLMGRPGGTPTRVLGSAALTRPYSAVQLRRAFSWARGFAVYTYRALVPRWLPARAQFQLLGMERELQLMLAEQEWYRGDEHVRGPWFVIEGQR